MPAAPATTGPAKQGAPLTTGSARGLQPSMGGLLGVGLLAGLSRSRSVMGSARNAVAGF